MSQCTQLPASLLSSGSLAWFLDQEGTVLSRTALSTTFLSYCCPIPMNIWQLLWQILTNFWRRFQSEYSEIHRRKNLEPPVTQPSLQKFMVTGHLSLEVSVLLQIPMVPVLPCYVSTASLGILNFSLSTGSSSSLTLFCVNSVLSCHGLTFPSVVRELCYIFFFCPKVH